MVLLLYTSLIILYILSVFFDASFLHYIVGIAAFLTLLTAAFRAKGLYFYSGLLFFLIGSVLFIMQDLPWHYFFLYFDSMLGVMSLFLVLPFLNSIIRTGHYDTNLNTLLRQNVQGFEKLYRRSFLVSHVLGLFLNVATIPLLKNTLHHTLKQFPREKAQAFLSQSLLRGYALCLSWSPMEVMVITSLDITGKTYIEIVLVMLMLVLLFTAADYTISFFKYRTFGLHIADSLQKKSNVTRKLLQMGGMLLLFVCLASIFQHYFQTGYLLSVVIVIIPISLLWACLIKKQKRYLKITIPHWKERTRGLSNYFFMFLSAGLFVNMLSESHTLSFLQDMFYSVSHQTLFFYVLIGLYFFVTSLVGFHPLVSITLLGELLKPSLPDASSISLTIVLITCSLATVMYSPFNLSVSILSDLLRINPFKIVRWNLPFALLYMSVSIFIAYTIGLLL
ncbi:hypothetical protein M3221_11185 [Domibacillus indicus]|uniref:hypothetical protein n=1 Tax=Domibacillus indicus TaxID=1437523 RepID=UPI00203B13B2|nr:hypothetical protein [Domibacillus indicus]MCM3788970.1 hypothetical protein [Domibacillus indicus]